MVGKEHSRAIVTFKRKDQRQDPEKDKRVLLLEALELEDEIYYYTSADIREYKPGDEEELPRGFSYDVNRYRVPILITALTEAEMERLRANGNVETVEPDEPLEPPAIEAPKAPASQEWVPWGVKRIGAHAIWPHERGRGIRIGLIDTGVDLTHPDLARNLKPGVALVGTTFEPSDPTGHGTHVAGIIAAEMNSSGVVGVAPEALLFPVKAVDGFLGDAISAIDWCVENKMDIINMSFSHSTGSVGLQAACEDAWEEGLLLVASIKTSMPSVHFPAKYPSVIAVSSVDDQDVIAVNASSGPEVDLCAPGEMVYSSLPPGSWGFVSGSSMAAPHVTGAAALAWSVNPMLSNADLRALLFQTALDLGAPGKDQVYGHGRVDAEEACLAAQKLLPY